MAESLLVGAALGAVFGELLKAVLDAKDNLLSKSKRYKNNLENLTKTLMAIHPLIKEIQQHNNNLDRPREELESLIRDMEEGTKLVYKCLKTSRINIYRRHQYQKQLVELRESLDRFFMIDMQAQIARDVKEALRKVRRIHSTVNKPPFLGAGSSSCNNSATEAVDSSQIKKDPFGPRKITAFERRLKENNSDLKELLRASDEFLGETNYGCSHKASLKDGTTLVVKRLTNVSIEKKEFERQMDIAHKLSQDPNVLPLRAWYCSNDEKLLICDYMPAGNLSTLLHGIREGLSTQLAWDSKMKILLGIAKGIAHIHSANGGQFSHGNITSSNVLLTVDMQVRISDHAIPLLVSAPIFLHGKDCCHAPEVIETKEVTQKSDVYSFGILLLEMLTVESPLDEDLLSWVQSEAVDDNLYFTHLWKLAVSCVEDHPELRPSMDEVIWEMEEITS